MSDVQENVTNGNGNGSANGNGKVDLQRLSRREREIYAMIIKGSSSAQIAGALVISIKTVESHRSRINQKLGCHSAFDLLRKSLVDGAIAVVDLT